MPTVLLAPPFNRNFLIEYTNELPAKSYLKDGMGLSLSRVDLPTTSHPSHTNKDTHLALIIPRTRKYQKVEKLTDKRPTGS